MEADEMSRGPEARFSAEFAKALKKAGIVGYRLETSHTFPGCPDWLLLLPNRVVFIELKAGSSIRPAQAIVHQLMRKLKIEIYVLTKHVIGAKIDSDEPHALDVILSTIVENRINVRSEPD
jgi:hypothetical protein